MLDRLELARTELKRRIEILKVDWDRERQELLRQLAEQGEKLKAAEATWRCFHCGFETSNPAEAEAHFGERDDAEEFTPTCTWWAKLSAEERAQEFQDLRQQLNDEQRMAGDQVARIEGLEYRLEGQLSEIRSFAPFRKCDSIHQVFHVYDSMEGRVLAAESERDGLKARIACAKVCSHIYTRVALTSTTTCPACTNGIVWPQPAEQTAAPVAKEQVK